MFDATDRAGLYALVITSGMIVIEEREIVNTLRRLAPRIAALPYKRNNNNPGHRVRSLCYRLWAENVQSVEAYINDNYPSTNG